MNLKRKIVIGIGVAAFAIFMLVYFFFDPSSTEYAPKCGFLKLTGYQCPGCGSQRAIHSLLHGDLVMAFRYNALLVISIPYIIFLLSGSLLRNRYPRLFAATLSYWNAIISLIIVIAWWFLRNIYHWYI